MAKKLAWNEKAQQYYREIGKRPNGTPYRAYLTDNERAAIANVVRVEGLWQGVKDRWADLHAMGMADTEAPVWDDVTLQLADAVRRGLFFIDLDPPDDVKDAEDLATWIAELRDYFPQIQIRLKPDVAAAAKTGARERLDLAEKEAEEEQSRHRKTMRELIYLPGVSRATLRATDECPHELKPLAELQYRGVIFSQANSKDWTIAAYLQTEKGGLNLTVARDQATVTSLRRAVEKLADAPLADLEAKSAAGELNGNYFDSLVSDDLVDDLLSWMSQPKETRAKWEPGRWETLCSRCIADYGFDPSRDGELLGAEKLGMQAKPVWKTAWKRFAVAPASYPGLEALLRKAKPQPKGGASLFAHADEFWPQDNEAEEADLRKELLDLSSLPVPLTNRTGIRAWAR